MMTENFKKQRLAECNSLISQQTKHLINNTHRKKRTFRNINKNRKWRKPFSLFPSSCLWYYCKSNSLQMKEILDLWYNFCLCTFILIFKKQNIILQNFKRKHISILCDLDIQRQIKRFIIVKCFMKTVFWNLSKP